MTDYLPQKRTFLDREVYLEDPVEIVVKKLFYRGEFLVGRDLFDLAVVGSSCRRDDLLKQLMRFEDKFNVFVEKFGQRKIELKRKAYSKTHRDSILNKKLCGEGKEIDICEDIIAQYASHKAYTKDIFGREHRG